MIVYKILRHRLRDLRFNKKGVARVAPPACDLILPPPLSDVTLFWRRAQRMKSAPITPPPRSSIYSKNNK